MFDRDEFIERIKSIAAYREKERGLTNSIRRTEQDIQEIEKNISAIQEDMIRAIVMLRSTKEKKRSEIVRLDEQIAEKKEQIAVLQEKRDQLTLESFGQPEIPPVYFGRFPQTEEEEVLPLEWDVLYEKNGLVFLSTTHVIEHMKYADELVNTPWENCKIRKWLNGSFLEESFTDEERALIFEKEIANPGNDPYKTPASENTIDKVFLPSILEVKRISDYDQDRFATATEYAKARGVYVNEETGGSYWWLRSNGGNMYNAAIVNFAGYVFEYGFYIVCDRYGVRPCLWIKP